MCAAYANTHVVDAIQSLLQRMPRSLTIAPKLYISLKRFFLESIAEVKEKQDEK
jgi:hypothetical protein